MQIAFALYPQFTALDIIGPFNMLAYGPGVEACFVAETLEPVTADVGTPRILPDLTFEQCPSPDVVVVPGGPGSRRIAELSSLVAQFTGAPHADEWDLHGLMLAARGLVPLPATLTAEDWQRLKADDIEDQLL